MSSARWRNTSWPCWQTRATLWPGILWACAWPLWADGTKRGGIFWRLCATSRSPPPLSQIYYNLGTVCQGLGERRAATRYYRQCVKLAPEHLYAHIRLGQLCEQGGRRAEARRCYERAAAIEDAHPGAPSLARRYLARVAVRQRRGGEARELLHEALVRNPRTPPAMLLLAKIIWTERKTRPSPKCSAAKAPACRQAEAWQTLARALRALGREDEARVAEARAVLA